MNGTFETSRAALSANFKVLEFLKLPHFFTEWGGHFFPKEIQPWPDKQPQQKLCFPLLCRVMTARLNERWSKIHCLCCIGFSRTLFFHRLHHDHSKCHKSGILVEKQHIYSQWFQPKSRLSFSDPLWSPSPRRSGQVWVPHRRVWISDSPHFCHSSFTANIIQDLHHYFSCLQKKKSPLDIDNSLEISGIKILEELEQNLCNLSSSKMTVWYIQCPPAGRISQS